MKKLILLILHGAFVVTPGFDCDDEARNQISFLERSLEWARTNATNADHARRQAVEASQGYRKELLAERTRRGWSDTYAVASAGACLLALLAALTVYYRRKGKE